MTNKELTILDKLEKQVITGDEALRSFDRNYLNLLQYQNADIPVQYLIDFIHKAQLTGADPRMNQIHLISYFNRKLGHKVATPVFSYHFFIDRANQTREYLGTTVTTQVEEFFNPFTKEMMKDLVSTAVCRRKDRDPIEFKARWSEFYNDRNPIWKDKPYVMLEKTAIANALRRTFPEVLTGMYLEEEVNFKQDPIEVMADAIREDTQRQIEEQTPEEEKQQGPLFRIQNGMHRGLQLKDVDVPILEEYLQTLAKRSGKGMKGWERQLLEFIHDYLENYDMYQDIINEND